MPVLPVLAYGVAPSFAAYPGSPSLSPETYVTLLHELVASLRAQGFRRLLVVNGHGGNAFAAEQVDVEWHDWWRAPRTWAAVRALDPEGTHASWMESFPWTRLPGVEAPAEAKRPVGRLPAEPAEVRALLGDGSFGGAYTRSDDEMLAVWAVGVAETRERIKSL